MKRVWILLFLLGMMLTGATFAAHANEPDSIKQLLQKKLTAKKRFSLLTELFSYYYKTGQVKGLEELTREMLMVAQRSKNDTLLIQGYLNVGNYLVGRADFEAGLEFYLKALHLAEELKLNKMMILLNNNIGGEYEDLKNYAEALKYQNKARQLLAAESKKSEMHVYSSWHMAYNYINLKDPKAGLRYLDEASNIMRTYNLSGGDKSNFIQAHIYWSYGQVYEQLKRTDKAGRAYQRAIAYSDSAHIVTPLILSLNSYSWFLYRQGQLQQAKLNALQGFNKAEKADFGIEIINAASALSQIYTALKMPDSANHYYKVKDTYQAKIFDQQRLSRLQDITFTEQLRQAEEQARLAELEEQRHHNIQYAAIAIAIISFLVIFLLLSRSSVAGPKVIEFLGVVGLLILFEFVNLLIHPVVGKYTHHSPLLMLCVMVGIAALLVPMHHKLEHWIKHKFVHAKH
ncbi:hypothetical protein LLH06_06635 [Mucilaginibacter daejeonensis]|uniref:tetratricopeptide repeat protein n=1 Tax=Mucilaginibacter daejeonensis TaxID=398049 RepID=UPI001D175CCC|nr:hypothetical protein [Mucilaginibacter daejeonensis]UEG54636.1 hypothetical protein LLH06_06635 [Mucilaginibacter daejeonensis]